jgi:hypothetical protein
MVQAGSGAQAPARRGPMTRASARHGLEAPSAVQAGPEEGARPEEEAVREEARQRVEARLETARWEGAVSWGPTRTPIPAGGRPRDSPASQVPLAQWPPLAEPMAGRRGCRPQPATSGWTRRTAAAAACSKPKTAARAWKRAGTATWAGRTVTSRALRRGARKNASSDAREGQRGAGRKPGIRTPRRTARPRATRSGGSSRCPRPRTGRARDASRSSRLAGSAGR